MSIISVLVVGAYICRVLSVWLIISLSEMVKLASYCQEIFRAAQTFCFKTWM